MKNLINVKLLKCNNISLVYVNNPKVACSSIKLSILKEKRLIHDNKIYTDYSSVLGCDFFSVVRNPFDRALSAYLNMVTVETDIWMSTMKLYSDIQDVSYSNVFKPISFRDFLEVLNVIANSQPEKLNPHFRCQYFNLAPDVIKYQFIGRLDDMDTVTSYLNEKGIQLENFTPHKTNAKNKTNEYYEENEMQLACNIYGKDFDYFNFSKVLKK
jgi:hypothetical protein